MMASQRAAGRWGRRELRFPTVRRRSEGLWSAAAGDRPRRIRCASARSARRRDGQVLVAGRLELVGGHAERGRGAVDVERGRSSSSVGIRQARA